jgi:phospholipid transport system substrate-binding protein
MKLRYSLLFLWLFCCGALAAASAPLDMLKQTTDQAISALNSDQATLKTNPKVAYRIINTIILPHFDLDGMARSVLPRDVWMRASASERSQFTQQFTNLLVRTYASALASYKNETVRYLPPRTTSASRVQINSTIIRQAGPSISVSYRLVSINNEWKIYDFAVDGISMLQSYRSQFSDLISQGNGISTLTQKLSKHNA